MRKVSVCLLYNEHKDVLLQFRSREQQRPLVWGFFGGGQEEGETAEEALGREIQEELGYDLAEFDFVVQYMSTSGNEMHLFVAPYDMEVSDLKISEGVGFAFFPIDYALEKLDLTATNREGILLIKEHLEV